MKLEVNSDVKSTAKPKITLKSGVAKNWLSGANDLNKNDLKSPSDTPNKSITDNDLMQQEYFENTPPITRRRRADIIAKTENIFPNNKPESKSRLSSLDKKILDCKLAQFKKTKERINNMKLEVNSDVKSTAKPTVSSNPVLDLDLPQKYKWILEIFSDMDRTLLYYHNSFKPCTFKALQSSLNAHKLPLHYDLNIFRKLVKIVPELYSIQIIKMAMYDADFNQKYDYQISLADPATSSPLPKTKKLPTQTLHNRLLILESRLRTHAKQAHYEFLKESYPDSNIPLIDDIKRFHPKFIADINLKDWKMANIGSLEVHKANRNSLGSSLLEDTENNIKEMINTSLQQELLTNNLASSNVASPSKTTQIASSSITSSMNSINKYISPSLSKRVKERESLKAIESVILSDEALAKSELKKFVEPFAQRMCLYLSESKNNVLMKKLLIEKIHSSYDSPLTLKRCNEALGMALLQYPENFKEITLKTNVYVKMVERL
ncbi:MAG: replication licensing factor Cdt1 [Marteilia pararefringens]